jgi:hypothetical protein
MINYTGIWNKVQEEGRKAVEKLEVSPMIVQQVDLLNRPIPGTKPEYVADGPCGFAWLEFRPASKAGKNDCEFVKWMRTNRIGSYDDYAKCWRFPIFDYNQSIQKKEAHAEAMAQCLRAVGINAHANSRLD